MNIDCANAGIKQDSDRKMSINYRKNSVATSIIAADLLEERFAITKRGPQISVCADDCLGGTIGAGLFVSSGQTLALGSPAFILVSCIVVTVLVYFIVMAITEVVTYLLVHDRTMSYYGYRYVSRSMGFVMG